jgi:ribonuclease Z
MTVEAFPVQHRGPDCFGFLFSERTRRPFLNERAEALGVPHGPERRLLVQGESITLADGRTIEADQVLGPAQAGTRLAFIGDLARTRGLISFVEGADALVLESTYLEQDWELARRFGHLTAAQAAQLARRANVRQLIITHISRRYHTRQIVEEAQAIFPNSVVASDFDHFQIKQANG